MKNHFKPSKSKKGKGKPGSKRREDKCVVTFNDKDREEYLTGFHKRKVERRKAAVVEIKNKIKEEQKKVREERQKEYLKMLQEREEALEAVEDELEELVTATTESVQYDHPNHTVTVTTISDLDLTGGGLLGLPANQVNGASDEENEDGEEQEERMTMPKKAFDPILNKKISHLTAYLHGKEKKKKGPQEGGGRRGQQSSRNRDRKSHGMEGRAGRFGKTTKKHRRRQTGKKVHHHD